MSDLVKFSIEPSWLLSRALPRPAELKYGFEHGWLTEAGTVQVATAIWESSPHMTSAPIEELALMLSDEFDRVPDVVAAVDSDDVGDDLARIWLFLALSWVHEHAGDFEDEFEVVEMLYADFGYPASMEGLVRFMPPPPGEEPGLRGLRDRWDRFLVEETEFFAARRSHDTAKF